ncbi:ATP synthase F1 subunit epsilon [Gaoshiqia sediminis]|uniref:ATP synthase F1 subunit epsilon n=1 Tax=Gaoshiqia sediminis TaxID=2986998 RepID=A0AA41Y4C3_9BACT|nr:ATP synthase F1 subunit epsilon [Gaoshiqia sediminis]MCW0483231.1 ATP synthase F1 subunit epsilon [Gaoshiqia sediminis]
MFLEILTPEKKLYAGEVDSVQLPGTKGLFEILKKHAPIISTLDKGRIRVIERSKRMLYIEIGGGVVESKNERIIVLAEPA